MPIRKQPKEQVEEKLPTLNRIIAEINKKHGENVIGRIPEMKNIMIERIPTGIQRLDEVLGGGMPKRAAVELYGVPSSGKSLIALLAVKRCQEEGLEAVYVDVENTFDPTFAEKMGVDIKKLVIVQTTIGEDTLDLICKLLASKPGIIVVDSVAAMITQGEMDEDMDKAFMAPKARLMSRALAKINALNKGTLVVFINQLRSTMAMYGPATTTTGGRALGHYASIRIEVKRGDLIRVDDKKTTDVIGQIVSYNVTKNKTAPPHQLGSFKFYYDDSHIE